MKNIAGPKIRITSVTPKNDFTEIGVVYPIKTLVYKDDLVFHVNYNVDKTKFKNKNNDTIYKIQQKYVINYPDKIKGISKTYANILNRVVPTVEFFNVFYNETKKTLLVEVQIESLVPVSQKAMNSYMEDYEKGTRETLSKSIIPLIDSTN